MVFAVTLATMLALPSAADGEWFAVCYKTFAVRLKSHGKVADSVVSPSLGFK